MDIKKRKNGILAKGIVHDFGQKVEIFFIFVETRRASVYKKGENLYFSKGVSP